MQEDQHNDHHDHQKLAETSFDRATCSDGIHPHVVQLYHGFDEANANLLTDYASCDPITGSAPLRSSLCRIRIAKP